MVAMGGGPEFPHQEGGKSKGVLLAVLPWPQEYCGKIIDDVREEFPHLEFHYFHENYQEKKEDRGKIEIPEGKESALCHQRISPSHWSSSSMHFLLLIQFL